MPPFCVPGPARSFALTSLIPVPEGWQHARDKPVGSLPHTVLPITPKSFPAPPLGKAALPVPSGTSCMALQPQPRQGQTPQSPVPLTDPLGPAVPAFSAALQCIPFVGMTLLALRAVLSRVGSGRILCAVCSGECQLLGRGPRGRGWAGLWCRRMISEGTLWVSAHSEVRPW